MNWDTQSIEIAQKHFKEFVLKECFGIMPGTEEISDAVMGNRRVLAETASAIQYAQNCPTARVELSIKGPNLNAISTGFSVHMTSQLIYQAMEDIARRIECGELKSKDVITMSLHVL